MNFRKPSEPLRDCPHFANFAVRPSTPLAMAPVCGRNASKMPARPTPTFFAERSSAGRTFFAASLIRPMNDANPLPLLPFSIDPMKSLSACDAVFTKGVSLGNRFRATLIPRVKIGIVSPARPSDHRLKSLWSPMNAFAVSRVAGGSFASAAAYAALALAAFSPPCAAASCAFACSCAA
jgi:hypothetical protein